MNREQIDPGNPLSLSGMKIFTELCYQISFLPYLSIENGWQCDLHAFVVLEFDFQLQVTYNFFKMCCIHKKSCPQIFD